MEHRVLVPDIWEMELYGVVNAGVPNRERVYLRTTTEVELGQFLLMTGWRAEDDAARPLDDFFWLSRAMKIAAHYWVIVYTGPGEQKMTKISGTEEPCLVLHWGKKTTLFNIPQIVPVLMRIGGISVGSHLGGDDEPKEGDQKALKK
jgi:hypothetical protein